jgi:hypothetical protein
LEGVSGHEAACYAVLPTPTLLPGRGRWPWQGNTSDADPSAPILQE